jgi:SPP1 family predicted phage head-tail adaptor
MKIGKLRHKITIEHEAKVSDGAGGWTEDWVAFASNVSASIDPVSGKEDFGAEQIQSETTHKIRIRYKAGITSVMRVNFKGRIFKITSPPINWEERNRDMMLMCSEVIPSAN